MLLDLAMAWDPVRQRCDFVVAGGTLAMDTTPLTPVLLSLGADRRAAPDDVLPDTVTEGSIVAGINPRRGWAGDALSESGDRAGSRLWLLEREKQTDDVLARAQDYTLEALGWLGDREGAAIDAAASWPTRTAMLLRVKVGAAQLQIAVPR